MTWSSWPKEVEKTTLPGNNSAIKASPSPALNCSSLDSRSDIFRLWLIEFIFCCVFPNPLMQVVEDDLGEHLHRTDRYRHDQLTRDQVGYHDRVDRTYNSPGDCF